ncbi:MAG TPA: hypothetical protein VK812_00050, partial [Candidatus Binatus sp.]|nr:hypothetical protein [Candidatus Binatus sp.]
QGAKASALQARNLQADGVRTDINSGKRGHGEVSAVYMEGAGSSPEIDDLVVVLCRRLAMHKGSFIDPQSLLSRS